MWKLGNSLAVLALLIGPWFGKSFLEIYMTNLSDERLKNELIGAGVVVLHANPPLTAPTSSVGAGSSHGYSISQSSSLPMAWETMEDGSDPWALAST